MDSLVLRRQGKHKTGEDKGDQPDECIVQPERNPVSEEERPQGILQKA